MGRADGILLLLSLWLFVEMRFSLSTFGVKTCICNNFVLSVPASVPAVELLKAKALAGLEKRTPDWWRGGDTMHDE
jgi:hypothetical protein